MFNTTLQDQFFQIPPSFFPLLQPGEATSIAIYKSAPGLDGMANPRGPPGGEIYIVATIQAELQIGPLTLTGFVQIRAAVSTGGQASLVLTGAVSTEIELIGALSGTINLTIFVGAKTGVVGRVQLALQAGIPSPFGADLFRLEGDFLLEINGVLGGTGPETIDTFLIGPDGKFLRNADGSLQVGQVTIEPGLRIRLSGKAVLLGRLELVGRFTLDLDDERLAISVEASLELAPFGSIEAVGGFLIDSQGVLLRATLTRNASFGNDIGLRFSGSAFVSFNSSAASRDLTIFGTTYTVVSGLLIRIDGSIEFLGFATANGFAEILVSATVIRVEFAVAFNLGGLTFSASGGAEVSLSPSDPGLALRLAVSVTADVEIFRISASGELQINTTDTTRLGVAGNSFLLALSGEVVIFEVLRFDASFSVVVRNGGWRFDFSAGIDFFGILTINGSGFLDSRGNFDITLQGRFVIGSDDFGLSGQATFRVWNIVSADTSGNPIYDFGLSIDASLRARLFGITLAGVGFNVTFSASSRDGDASGGRVKIQLSVTVSIDLGLFSISKTARFTIGYLQFPPPVFLAGDADGPDANLQNNWDPAGDGILYLNVGSRAGFRNIAEDETDEAYVIRDGGFDDEGRRLTQISAFGRTNSFANVTEIRARTFDGGADQLFIESSVTVPVFVEMGAGDDVVSYAGANALSTIDGGADADYIEWTGTLTTGRLTINGGAGDDFITLLGGAGNVDAGAGRDKVLGSAFADILAGGPDDDEIVGNGGADMITGGDGQDKIVLTFAGLGSTVDGGTGADVLVVSATSGSDVVTLGVQGDGSGFEIDPASGASITSQQVETWSSSPAPAPTR